MTKFFISVVTFSLLHWLYGAPFSVVCTRNRHSIRGNVVAQQVAGVIFKSGCQVAGVRGRDWIRSQVVVA